MKKISLSPIVFLFLEVIFLLPSILFIVGEISWVFFKNEHIYRIVIGRLFMQNIMVTIVSPFTAGFLSYHYIERYKPKGYVLKISKGILMYSIIQIGLVSAYYVFSLFS